MATAVIDSITTRYEVYGSGTPLLLFSPGGFDATLDKWTTLGVYARTRIFDHLSRKYMCVAFDRRESGRSGGRVECVTWAHYVRQGRGLLRHLGITRAHIMGGCMGCSSAIAFGVSHPEVTLSLLLWWPVGGAKYRINGHRRFAEHLDYVRQNGLEAVVALATGSDTSFGQDPRVGPWVSVLRHDPEFAASYARQDLDQYLQRVAATARTLFDRDTAPGAEPEDLFQLSVAALIVPGRDASHATSAARYLEECLPNAQYWDVPVEEQTERNAPERLLTFLNRVERLTAEKTEKT
ncbi:MAG TPA: alpha/beta hydrolase [Vicinamibacterales bacterium]|nr:alpha/beta hydrolase [Vicinamibacterales bacterium]